MAKPYFGLKVLIEKHGYKQQDIANKLNMNRSTFSQKINRKDGRDFSLSEANMISDILDEPLSNFFTV
ncbi:helix-turn-helix transcriptional regulator [Streptococcus orisratti]|uniref:helix-turn-helix transcriptional regulator n=1 Tax=Streptococcus orisratti TaxID=114652 RepID=UPI0029438924|nr:helix-turn-helix transcriptional regulator [Streptococcus orisratti]